MSNQPEKVVTPAYGSVKTITTVLNEFREQGADHLPDRIDRSLMPRLSGSGANETISTLKFLGLVSESGATTADFEKFVMSADMDRKPIWGDLVKRSYGFVFNASEFNIERATAAMVADLFRKQGVSGGTLTRAITFFLAACKEAGIKVSPNIKAPPAPRNGTTKPKGQSSPVSGAEAPLPQDQKIDRPPQGTHKFELPIPGKPSVLVYIPDELDGEDWDMFSDMFQLYVKRWKGFKDKEKEKGPSSK